MSPNFSKRSDEIELMDDLACKGNVVHQTLHELDVINKWLGGNAVTLSGVKKLMSDIPPQKEISIVDLGCGSGDVLRKLSTWAVENGRHLKLTGIDANPHIIQYARDHTNNHDNITYLTENILSEDFSARTYDVIIATLFFHHFSSAQLSQFLQQAVKQVRIGIVINDIHRHWLAYHSIAVLTRMLSKSSMVQYDAPLSVLRAFSKQELEEILAAAGIKHYSLHWKWAFRWQLIILA